jgi:hypothetical protein
MPRRNRTRPINQTVRVTTGQALRGGTRRKDQQQDRQIAALKKRLNAKNQNQSQPRLGPQKKKKRGKGGGKGNMSRYSTGYKAYDPGPGGWVDYSVKSGLSAFDAFGKAPVLSSTSTGPSVDIQTIAQQTGESLPLFVVNQIDPSVWTGGSHLNTLGDTIPSTPTPLFPADYVNFGPVLYLFCPQDTGVYGWRMSRTKGPIGYGNQSGMYSVNVKELRFPKFNMKIPGTSANMPMTMRQGKLTTRTRNISPGLVMGGMARVTRLCTGLDLQACGVWLDTSKQEGIDDNWDKQGENFDHFCDKLRVHPKTVTYSGAELSETHFINSIPVNQVEYMNYESFAPLPLNDHTDPRYQQEHTLHHYGPGTAAWKRIKGGLKEFVQPHVVGWTFNYTGGQPPSGNISLYPGKVTISSIAHTRPAFKLPEAYSVVLVDSAAAEQTIRYGSTDSVGIHYNDSLEYYMSLGLFTSTLGPLPMEFRISGPDPYPGSLTFDGNLVPDASDEHQQQALGVQLAQSMLSGTDSPPMSFTCIMFEPNAKQVPTGTGANWTPHNENTNSYELTTGLQALVRYDPGHIMNAVSKLQPTQPPSVITKIRQAAERTESFMEKVGSVASKVLEVGRAVAPVIGKVLKYFF